MFFCFVNFQILFLEVRGAKAAAEYAAVFWAEKYRKVDFVSL